MVSSLIGPQYHDTQFWKFAQSAQAGDPNDFSVAMVPTFAADFEVRASLVVALYEFHSSLSLDVGKKFP